VIAATFGVASWIGASIVTSIEIAILAVTRTARGRYTPAIRAQTGLFAFAFVALITQARLTPTSTITGRTFADPISVWYHFFSPSSAPIDPVRLYVGNVPGPVFATSLLAVARSASLG